MSTKRIAIAANFTIEPIEPIVRVFLEKLGLESDVVFAPYNQIFQQLLDPNSVFSTNMLGANVIFIRTEDLIDGRAVGGKYGPNELTAIRANTTELGKALLTAERFSVPVFVFICPPSDKIANDHEAAIQITDIESSMFATASGIPNLYLFSTEQFLSRYSVRSYNDPKGDALGHIPYTDEYFAALGTDLVRKIDASLRRPHKVIVLDCDNTLWDGICGEDGIDGIGFSEARLYLQKFVIEQSNAGILICICSKNNEDDVWEVFEKRSEMSLKREHLVSWRINWAPKSTNLRSLADELQLGLDSFVFIDDDSAVCAEVRTNCPEVLTIQIPEDVAGLPRMLEHIWIFDHLKITKEDRERAASYKSQVERNNLRSQTPNLKEFLTSLELVCDISEIAPEQVSRVSQVSLRTNQFNSTGIRRSESDVRSLINEGRSRIKTVSVKDRFGDYGLVGVIFYEENGDSLDVSSFMLSCRVLGRGVEHTILRKLGRIGLDRGKRFVNIFYISTPMNVPFHNFLAEVGEDHKLTENEGVVYRIPVEIAANIQPNDNAPRSFASTVKAVGTSHVGDRRVSHGVYVEIATMLSQTGARQPQLSVSKVSRTDQNGNFAAARNKTEQRLVEIWESLLNLKEVGVEDDFFELGGDSLRAVRLFVEIDEEFGIELPLSTLIGSPTIASLARSIDGTDSIRPWKYLVPIQAAGTRIPLFCFHAAGGNVLFYRDLANELGSDQPVYGLQARGVADKTETAHDRVEDMARDYLKEIRQFQSSGPYRLCGSSFGGLVAFETARQLCEKGEEVEVLGLFDTYAPGYLQTNASQVSPVERGLQRIKNLGRQLREIGSIRDRAAFIVGKAKKLRGKRKRQNIWKKNQFDLQYGKATGKELPVDIQRNHRAIESALARYNPDVYSGTMILFRAADQPKGITADRFLGWGRYVTDKIIAHEVPGTHGALTVYPFAKHLAAELATFLGDGELHSAENSIAMAATR